MSDLPSTSPSDEARLLDFLHERDVPCPLCAYNLRNLPTPVCPECRHALVITVGIPALRLTPYVLAIAPFIGGAGIALLFAALTVAHGRMPNDVVIPMYAVSASGMLTIPMLYFRRHFLRLPRPHQLMYGGFNWLVHLIGLVLIAAAIV
jgi:hypothetical protein